ncbi:DUF6934 family protein [Pedobacter hartonius]|nr:hypothetical protein [Pedobacter hartonius]
MTKQGYHVAKEKSKLKLRFLFFSEGVKTVFKVVDYDYIGLLYFGTKTFNLSLGDLDPITRKIEDNVNTENGDVYDVLNTVLNTVPIFFDNYPKCTLMVKGSDSGEEFATKCKASCTKKCIDVNNCKNKDRRINVYSRYVSSNYDELVKEYAFFGANNDMVEPFEKHKKYDTVFVQKNINFVI